MQQDYNNIVVSSRVRLARNFSDIPFPSMLTDSNELARKVISNVTGACDKLYHYELHRMSDMDNISRMALLERHLISPNLVANVDNGAVVTVQDKGISIMINEEDHVRAQCVMRGLCLNECYKRVSDFDDMLSSQCDIAFDKSLGYLTACPTNLGTGMRASVMLFLPALTVTGEINSIIREVQQMGLTVRGTYGEGTGSKGYLYQVSNQLSIGISEEEIIRNVTNVVTNICAEEQKACKRWRQAAGIKLDDKIMRSFGILLYARTISSDEFMEHIANVKLGVDYGILDLNMDMLNTLTELCQPANLSHYGGGKMSADKRDELRAQLIREKIQLK